MGTILRDKIQQVAESWPNEEQTWAMLQLLRAANALEENRPNDALSSAQTALPLLEYVANEYTPR